MQETLRIVIEGNVDRQRYRRLLLSAEEKLDVLNIPYGNIVLWSINTRAKKRFGQCKELRKGCYQIEIAETLFAAKDDAVEEVILHELLHSCKDCMNHGAQWKRYASLVNEQYGCNITTTGSNKKYGLLN